MLTAEHEQTSKKFLAKPPCCQPFGAARWFRQHMVTILDVLKHVVLFYLLAWLVKLSVADIERRHAWNSAHCTLTTRIHNFIAKYVNRELKNVMNARRAEEGMRLAICDMNLAQLETEAVATASIDDNQDQQAAAPSSAIVDAKYANMRKVSSALELFRDHLYETNRVLAVPIGKISFGYWTNLMGMWDALLPEDRARYVAESASLKLISKANRDRIMVGKAKAKAKAKWKQLSLEAPRVASVLDPSTTTAVALPPPPLPWASSATVALYDPTKPRHSKENRLALFASKSCARCKTPA